MTRVQAVDLAKRIQDLPDNEQAKLLARVLVAEGRNVPWARLETIQRRIAKLNLDPQQVDRDAIEAVRTVRRERRRGTRT